MGIASRLPRSNTILLRPILLMTRKLPSPMLSTPSTKSTHPMFMVFTINNNLLTLEFMESPNNTNKFIQELMVPTVCLLFIFWVSVKPRLNLRLRQKLKLNTTGLNTMVNTTVPLPAPTLSPVILMLQLTQLDTPPPTPPLILLDIPASTTPLLLDIPAHTTLV